MIKKLWNRLVRPTTAQAAALGTDVIVTSKLATSQSLPAPLLKYLKLEQRRVLNADFTLTGTNLDLFNFSEAIAGNQALAISDAGLTIDFTLNDGTWNGVDADGLNIILSAGDTVLSVTKDFLTSLGVVNISIDGFDLAAMNVSVTNNTDLTALTGLLDIESGGNITQTGSLAVGQSELTGASIQLDNAANDFDNVAIVTTGALTPTDAHLVDVDDLTVDSAEAVTKLRFEADGIALNGPISATTVFLGSTNGVTQALAGTITADELILQGSGAFNLNNSGNDVNLLAADVANNLTYVDQDDVTIARLTCDLDTIVGVDVGGNFVLNTSAGNGNILQNNDAAIIVAGTTDLVAGNGQVCLLGADNDGDTINDNDFVGSVDASGSVVELVDRNDLTTGIITAVDDIYLRAGDGATGALIINDDLTTTALGGQILLQADSGATQSAASIITTNQLLLGSATLADARQGDFILNRNNLVAQVAAQLDNNFRLHSVQSLDIADLSYNSACGTTADICGIDIGETAILQVTGDLTQTAAAIVNGATTLTVTGLVCLTGGDCTGDGLNDNDFVGAVSASGTTIEIVDSNALTIASAVATDDVFLRSGDNGVGALLLTGAVNTSSPTGQVLLQSDSGVTQGVASVISTNQLILGSETVADARQGNFILNRANQIDQVAAQLDNNLTLVNARSIEIADLDYSSACGTNASVTGVDVDGNLASNITGDITQSASIQIAGTAGLTASGLVCLTGADDNGDTLNDNDFVGAVNSSGTTIEIVDRNALTVTTISATDDIFLRSGDGAAGALTLNGNLTTTALTGQILLQSDTGVLQNAGSVITTNQLLLGSATVADARGGNFVLNQANQVDQLAARLNNDLTFTNGRDLEIASLNYTSACGTTAAIAGVNIGGNLATNITGNLTQSAAVTVTGTSNLVASGFVCLVGPGNDFTGAVSANATTVEIVDINALTVATITAVDDIFLRSGAGAAGAMTLTGNLTTTDLAGQILLQSDSGVSQNAGSVITTNQLVLGSATEADARGGNFVLNQTNQVDRIAAQLNAALTFVNGRSLLVDSLTYSSICGTSAAVAGVDIGTNLILNVTGNITQVAAVVVDGTSNLTATGFICLLGPNNDFVGAVTASGTTVEIVDLNALIIATITATDDVFLRSGDGGTGGLSINGNITTTAIAGQVLLQSDSGVTQAGGSVITTNQLILGSATDADARGGNFILTAANQVDQIAARIDGNLSFTNGRSLDVADLAYSSICGTTADVCGLEITGNLTLNITGDVTQSAAVIVGGTSSLTATGFICFTGGDCSGDGLNDNDFTGAVSASGTTVEIVDRNALVVATITATNNIFLRSGDNGSGTLTLNGNLTTTAAAGRILLQSDSGVTQAGVSVITTNGLLLGSSSTSDARTGDFTLNGANVVNQLAAQLDDALSFRNTLALTVDNVALLYASVCGTNESLTGITAPDKIRLQANGITINSPLVSQTVYLISTNGVTQAAGGTITTTNLMLEGSGLFNLDNPLNDTDFLAADVINGLRYFDRDDVTIAVLTCDADTIQGVTVGGNFVLDTSAGGGNVTQLADAPIVVTLQSTINAGTGVICLLGGDADGDTLNDNDFVQQVSAFGQTVELVDRNDLIVGVVTATDDILLRAGSSVAGQLTLNGAITTTAPAGQVLLQARNGVVQNAAGIITTNDLILGSDSDATARGGNFSLDQANVVNRIAGHVDGTLTFTNTQNLQISSLQYQSICGTTELLAGIDVINLDLVVQGNITDAAVALATVTTRVQSIAQLTAETAAGLRDRDIILGESANEALFFTDHSHATLVANVASPEFLEVQARNATLFVDSTVILSDSTLNGTLFVNATGHILQTPSLISAPNAAFVAGQSIQFSNTEFTNVAAESGASAALIRSIRDAVTTIIIAGNVVALNPNIGNTFTGHLDNYFDPNDFSPDNHDFVNENAVGVLLFDQTAITVTNVFDPATFASVNGITAVGDVHVETDIGNIDIREDIIVLDTNSNITIAAAANVNLLNGASLRRFDGALLQAVVNTTAPFLQLTNPRSFLDVAFAAFGDSKAQVNPFIGIQDFQFDFGSLGEQSFNVIVGWFVDVVVFDGVNAAELAQLTDIFQLLNANNFLHINNGRDADGFALGVAGTASLENLEPFEFSVLVDNSRLLSQFFLTNDSQINLFANAQNAATIQDLNFTLELLPTQAGEPFAPEPNVERPQFSIPDVPVSVPTPLSPFTSPLLTPEEAPIALGRQPESYYLIRYSEDDDGVYEHEFRWTGEENPESIRSLLEGAALSDDQQDWDENSKDTTNKIKLGRLRPGIYYIFEVLEGQELQQAVDEPINRTDIENARPARDANNTDGSNPANDKQNVPPPSNDGKSGGQPESSVTPPVKDGAVEPDKSSDSQQTAPVVLRFSDRQSVTIGTIDPSTAMPLVLEQTTVGETASPSQLEPAARGRWLQTAAGSALVSGLMAVQLAQRNVAQNSEASGAKLASSETENKTNLFSRASRWWRRNKSA